MKASTLFCAAAFLFLVTRGCFGPPGMLHHGMLHGGFHLRGRSTAASAARHGGDRAAGEEDFSLAAIGRRIDKARGIVERLERSERLVKERIDEIRRSADRERRRRDGFHRRDGGDAAGMRILLRRLAEIEKERALAGEALERLKTERVAVAVRRDVLETAAVREALARFAEDIEPGPKSPVERLAEEGRGGGGTDGGGRDEAAAPPPGRIRYEVF